MTGKPRGRAGGRKPTPGREGTQRRTIVVTCTDQEWAALTGLLPQDTRDRILNGNAGRLLGMRAAAGVE